MRILTYQITVSFDALCSGNGVGLGHSYNPKKFEVTTLGSTCWEHIEVILGNLHKTTILQKRVKTFSSIKEDCLIMRNFSVPSTDWNLITLSKPNYFDEKLMLVIKDCIVGENSQLVTQGKQA